MSLRADVIRYVKRKYKCDPEYLWRRFPDYAVFRRKDDQKWFGIIMDVPVEKLGIHGSGRTDILNVKTEDPVFADMLIRQEGFFRGYHFSKGSWVSILLDGTVPMETIRGMIDESFAASASAKKKQKLRPPKEWIIPANPKYYDIVHAFDDTGEIEWKQGSGIRTGDTVYMYVAAPVSAVLYKCLVTETDIPYRYRDRNLTITALMKIKLLKRYEQDRFTFDILKEEYGIYAVRGPRGIPDRLSRDL